MGLLAWLVGAIATAWLDGRADLGSQALPLVLSAALASIWWPAWAAAAACVAATLAFNWHLVDPRGSLQVSLPRDVTLLLVMLLVSLVITFLMARQRHLVRLAHHQTLRVRQLHQLSEALRAARQDTEVCTALSAVLAQDASATIACLVRGAETVIADEGRLLGATCGDEPGGLRLCLRLGTPLGPGTGREESQPGWYLPMRGRSAVQGAALIRGHPAMLADPLQRIQAQALCDLAGQALERLASARVAEQAREAATAHALRSTLLAAISHDCRTPLAAILGAASSLSQQGERLGPAQRRRLSDTIVDEARQLGRMTENALQLTRLGAAPDAIAREWESIEELAGAVLRRVRARDPERRVRVRIAGTLPLVRCDAVLIVQMLENLIDNALKFSPATSPVEILCRDMPSHLLLAVRDRGPGIPVTEQARLFEPFERGDEAKATGVRGTGLGLALCQAVARAHGSELRLRPRGHGGISLEVRLPVTPLPAQPAMTEPAP